MFLIYSEDDSENGQCSYGSLVQQCLTASLYDQFHKVVFKHWNGTLFVHSMNAASSVQLHFECGFPISHYSTAI